VSPISTTYERPLDVGTHIYYCIKFRSLTRADE
jgi:hypothetical protein